MSDYDQHTGQQIKFLRSDPTGRLNPIVDESRIEFNLEDIITAVIICIVLALFAFHRGWI